MASAASYYLALERGTRHGGQHRQGILASLAAPNTYLAAGEVEILYPQRQGPYEAEPRAVKQ